MSYHIDDHTLRDEPDDRQAASELVETLQPSGEKVGWLRMLGKLERAEVMAWSLLVDAGGPESVEAARDHRRLSVEALRPAVRLAHVLHWQGRFRDADVLFESVIVSARAMAGGAADGSVEQRKALSTLAFAVQHLGKSRFDEGRLDEALASFEEALELRQRIRAPADQVSSSRQAITATLARLSDTSRNTPTSG